MVDSEERIVDGSGNVFADLGSSDADELLVCAELTHLIHAELRYRNLTPAGAARLLGLKEAEAAQLVAGRFARVPTEQPATPVDRVGSRRGHRGAASIGRTATRSP